MTISRVDTGEDTTLRIEGVLDAVTSPSMRPVLDTLVGEQRKKITVDLEALRLIDSSGVGAIVSLFKRVKGYGGQMTIVGLRDQPLAIFRLLRLDRVFVS